MLLPSSRTNLQHVNAFHAEAKTTATTDHPHIVNFVGNAWDSHSDLCVALEFMGAGDLRALLTKTSSRETSSSPENWKLTDFGISREMPDQTMTAGVGTSLWMAPEVMFG
ncbi:TKL protein kinase [Phytophthora cinnamomi]|uniref:TKL protein kinase n=1 Tax=Phytophthora cinnamomi TaxID=4785 RepID=UPI0035595ED2|nr:TKL protein kinase [Phytophthora cinnamomi]